MIKIASSQAIAGALLAFGLSAAPAAALNGRTFVSGKGTDAGACTAVTAPCRTFAFALTQTVAGGEIDVLDPAGYGGLTISKAISIQGHGVAGIGAGSGAIGITINAGANDKVDLRGLLLDGVGAGAAGIVFHSGASLNIQDCVIRNFAGTASTSAAITFLPIASSKLFVSNTLVSDNGGYGITVAPSGSGTVGGVFDHVRVENNAIIALIVFGSTSTGTINFTVSDSVFANNGNDTIFCQSTSAPTSCMVRNTTVANNVDAGLHAEGTSGTLRVTHSTITGNGTGWFINNGGTLLSYGDNEIDGNTAVNTAPPTIPQK